MNLQTNDIRFDIKYGGRRPVCASLIMELRLTADRNFFLKSMHTPGTHLRKHDVTPSWVAAGHLIRLAAISDVTRVTCRRLGRIIAACLGGGYVICAVCLSVCMSVCHSLSRMLNYLSYIAMYSIALRMRITHARAL